MLAVLSACAQDDGSPSPGPVEGGTWVTLAPMNEARQEVGVAEVDGRVYVVGGFRANGSTANTMEVYDPGSNTWTFAAPMPLALNHCAAAGVNGRLYVMGGSLGTGAASAATLAYDPRANAWAVRAPMPSARSAASCYAHRE